MVGVSRVVVGPAVPHPVGNPALKDDGKEKALRRRIVEAALKLLQTEVEEGKSTIVTVE
jgi:glycine reductase complex component B subunit gamma